MKEILDTPVVQATETLKKMGRPKGTKVTHTVKAEEFVPKYRELVAAGKSIDEIAVEFKLGKMTVIQKRLAYNKASLEANCPLNLPLPASTSQRGAKKIDWSKFAAKVEESAS